MHKGNSESASEPPLAKIAFRDEDGDVETLWAFDLGNNLYALDNTSWYQYGVSYRDIVEALPQADGLPLFTRMVKKSGYRTIRVRHDVRVPQELLDRLVKLGCSYEGANPKFIGIDVPPEAELSSVVNELVSSNAEWEHADPTYEQLHGTA